MISSGLGRYGPFVLHDGTYANVESIEDVFSIGLNRAVSVIADKQSKAGAGRGRAAAVALKELGEHAEGGAITVRDGRYGPYVNWGKINATLPQGKDPQSVTVEEALALIAERAAKSGTGKGKTTKAKAKTTATKSSKAAADGAAKKTTKAKAPAKAKPKTAAKAKKD